MMFICFQNLFRLDHDGCPFLFGDHPLRPRLGGQKAGGRSARGNWKFWLARGMPPIASLGAGENFHCAASAACYAADKSEKAGVPEDIRCQNPSKKNRGGSNLIILEKKAILEQKCAVGARRG